MPKIHSFPIKKSPLFWHTVRINRNAPLVHIAKTSETTYPYRVSDKSLVVKLFGTWGIVIGCWHGSDHEEFDALMDALNGRQQPIWTDEGNLTADWRDWGKHNEITEESSKYYSADDR